MAAKLTVDIVSDFNRRGVNDAESSIGRLSGTVSKFAKVAGAAFAGKQILDFAGSVVSAGSDLQQSMGAIEKTFTGSGLSAIQRFGKEAATSIGVSESAFNDLAAVSGSMLQNLGFDSDKASKATIDLATRASDLAAVFGGKTTDVMDAFNAALRGEFDSLEKYGVKLSAASVEQEALNQGLVDSEGKATQAGKAQAALSLIMSQSASKAGQFASETNTIAGRQQILSAQWENMKAQLGTAILPLLERLGTFAATTLVPAIQGVVNVVSRFVGSLTGANAQGEQTAAFLARVRTGFAQLWAQVRPTVIWVGKLAVQLWNDLQPAFAAIAEFIVKHVLPGVQRLAASFNRNVMPAIRNVMRVLEPLFRLFASKIVPIILRLAGPVFDQFVRGIDRSFRVIGTLNRALESAWRFGSNLGQMIGGYFVNAWNAATRAVNAVLRPIQAVISAAQRAVSAISRIRPPGSGIVSSIGGFVGGLFRSAGPGPSRSAVNRAITGRSTRAAGLRSTTATGAAIQLNGVLLPQETARQIAQVMNGARVRTGYAGIRP